MSNNAAERALRGIAVGRQNLVRIRQDREKADPIAGKQYRRAAGRQRPAQADHQAVQLACGPAS